MKETACGQSEQLVHLSVCPSICPSIRLSIHLFLELSFSGNMLDYCCFISGNIGAKGDNIILR